ncbi:hypothetical protein SKAU_G00043660 [Synaphobranchus kaupii]|uniref:Uncharacterized protein n=1 Tax=Synaphobranchus kaupii TaxID=118154 RepID=A0A9Q1J7Z4_SYNKA|nr:hypothetical protein SKAU_G00043660 [Synaphobranchus kaupii]
MWAAAPSANVQRGDTSLPVAAESRASAGGRFKSPLTGRRSRPALLLRAVRRVCPVEEARALRPPAPSRHADLLAKAGDG